MLLLQRTGFRLEELLQALVFFAIFLLPVARGILESRRKRAEAKAARESTHHSTDEPVEEDGTSPGREMWEQLLRGELPGQHDEEVGEQPAPQPPRPASPPPRPVHRSGRGLGRAHEWQEAAGPREVRPGAPASVPWTAPALEQSSHEREGMAPGTTGSLGGLGEVIAESEIEGSTEVALGPEIGSGAPVHGGSRVPARRVDSPAARPFAGLPAVDLSGLSAAELDAAWDLTAAPPSESARAWRAAVVSAVVLGAPTCLRAPGDGPMAPPGLD